jgi:mRNA interferase HicA
MKISEFKRWLESRGVEITDGARHWKLRLHDKRSTLPRHPAQELKEGTRRAILKQLGLE